MFKFKKSELLNEILPSELNKFFTNKLSNYLIIKDGHIVTQKLSEDLEKLRIENIEETIEKKDAIFTENPFLLDSDDETYKYNIENINSGVFINVPKNLTVKETINIFYIQENSDLVNNTLIVLNENSELNYFEYLLCEEDSSINFVSNSIIKENSKLTYSGISNFSKKSKVKVIRNSYVSSYGNSKYSIAEVNDSLTDSKTNIYLNETNASAKVSTVAIASDDQEIKIRQFVEHNAPDTEGIIENYGVANNKSILVFEGVGKINKNMKRSIAKQQNKGIVLGETSRLDANPLLLIDEYDVEASHGAAIGKIDEDQLYYLMSRGLTLKNAVRLVISGFLSPIIKRLSTNELVEDFISIVERKTL